MFPIKSVKSSFDFRIQSEDERTPWQPATAVSRSKITEIQLTVTPSAYSQLSTCQLRNIKTDEWDGSFDGEDKEKLQLAIDPVLRRLKSLLVQAQVLSIPPPPQ
ncbi:MAG: hypothetical protein M2R46_05159 [Verrucomicrobia subdivision 3 bacterium]|nr:hypothetical protein [Limisphaerales bacterium]